MLRSLLDNPALYVPFIAWLLAQILKVIIILIRERQIDLSRFVGSGGMPSSHSAIVTSLATVIARRYGLDSGLFAMSVWFAAIIMYDAAGVRRSVGAQAAILNRMLDEVLVEHKLSEKRLAELIGHTPIQVIAGGALGIFCGWIGT